MGKVGELFISLRASTASFSKDLKRSTKLTKQSAQAMTKAFKIVGVAIAATGAALAALTKKSIDAADNLAKLSEKTGISTEALSKLEFAASQSGINLETLSQRMVNLARRAKEGDRGVLSYKQAFDKLNISLRDSGGQLKGTEELLLDIADRFSKMEDGTLKAALATDIFSNQGVALIPFLNQGREGIKALTDEAERLGLVIDSKTAKAAERFNDNLDRLKFAVVGVGNRVASDLLPQLNRLTESTVNFATKGEGAKRLAEKIAGAFKSIGAAGLVAAFAFNKLQQVVTTFTGNERTRAAQRVARAEQQLLNVEQAIFLQERALFFKRGEAFEEAVEKLKGLRRELQQVQSDLEGKKLFANLVGPASFDPLFAGVESLEQLGEAIKNLFSGISVDVEETSDKVAASVGNIKKAVTDLNTVIVKSPVAKPPFDQNALISQREEMEFISKALGGIPSRVEDIGGAFEAIKPTLNAVKDIGRTFTDSLISGFEGLITRGGKLSDVFQQLAADLARMLARAALLSAIGGIVKSLFPGTGNPASSAGGGGGGFGGFFQHGGTLRAGQVGIVGESGAEIISPGVTSTITPLGAGVTINQHFDFRGAGPGVMAEVKRGMRQLQRETLAIARAQVNEAALRSA